MKRFINILITIFLMFYISSCSIKKMAMNGISDMLSSSMSSDNAFMSDDDYEFVGASLPFAIKMYESIRNINKTHYGINVVTGSLYVMYANAYIELPSNKIEDYEAKVFQNKRAKNMYLKGGYMILDYLDTMKQFKGLKANLSTPDKLTSIISNIKNTDINAFYWMTAGIMGAYSIDPLDFELSSKTKGLVKILEKLYEIDKEYNDGSLAELMAQIYASPIVSDIAKAKTLLDEAKALSKDKTIGYYLTYAKSFLIPQGKYEQAIKVLEAGLKVDIKKYPSLLLLNTITRIRINMELKNLHEMLDFDSVDETGEE